MACRRSPLLAGLGDLLPVHGDELVRALVVGDDGDEPLVDVDLLFGRPGRAQLGFDPVIFGRQVGRHASSGKIIAKTASRDSSESRGAFSLEGPLFTLLTVRKNGPSGRHFIRPRKGDLPRTGRMHIRD